MTSYGEHDLSEEPVIVLDCGHLFTISTLDAHAHLTNYYAEDGAASPLPGEFARVPTCPECRVPITSTQRYGRPVKKAMVDSLMQRYFTRSRRVMNLAEAEVQALEHKIASAKVLTKEDLQRCRQIVKSIRCLTTKPPPTQQVYEASTATMQRMGVSAAIAKDLVMRPPPMDICLEAKVGLIRILALPLKCRLESILKTGMKKENVDAVMEKLEAQVEEVEAQLLKIEAAAVDSQHHQVAALALYERTLLAASSFRVHAGTVQGDEIAAKVRALCEYLETHWLDSIRARYRDRTAHLRKMVENISREELFEIMQAMTRPLPGEYDYGGGAVHWYTSPNGHPYYIGDCGMAMRESSCPQCGARIGGTNHQLLEDNRQAHNLLALPGGET